MQRQPGIDGSVSLTKQRHTCSLLDAYTETEGTFLLFSPIGEERERERCASRLSLFPLPKRDSN